MSLLKQNIDDEMLPYVYTFSMFIKLANMESGLTSRLGAISPSEILGKSVQSFSSYGSVLLALGCESLPAESSDNVPDKSAGSGVASLIG